jgi:hypothetical protein
VEGTLSKVTCNVSETEIPIIGKSEYPFFSLNVRKLLTKYAANGKSCLTWAMFTDCLRVFDAKVSLEKRKICFSLTSVLFIHKTPSYPGDVKVMFFHPKLHQDSPSS